LLNDGKPTQKKQKTSPSKKQKGKGRNQWSWKSLNPLNWFKSGPQKNEKSGPQKGQIWTLKNKDKEALLRKDIEAGKRVSVKKIDDIVTKDEKSIVKLLTGMYSLTKGFVPVRGSSVDRDLETFTDKHVKLFNDGKPAQKKQKTSPSKKKKGKGDK